MQERNDPTARRFVLIDRDGTINVERHYLSDPDQLELLPGAAEGIRRLKAAGYGVCILTNQSGIARGYFDMERLDQIHRRLSEMLAREGAAIDGIYICPHGPQDKCVCRKPLPGMIEQAVHDHGFDPARAYVIGDKDVDVDMGRGVGATTILVRTGHGMTYAGGRTRADHEVDDLAAAATLILASAG